MSPDKKPEKASFEDAAKEAGEAKPFDDVLRKLVKEKPQKKGSAPEDAAPESKD